MQGQRADTKAQGDKWDWGARCKTHKESIKEGKTNEQATTITNLVRSSRIQEIVLKELTLAFGSF